MQRQQGKVDEMERQDRHLGLFCGVYVLSFSCCTVCGAIVRANKRMEDFCSGKGKEQSGL